jgi:hypothetical protein
MALAAANCILNLEKILGCERENSMSSKPSEQMMDLLQELALLKELDKDGEKVLRSDVQAAESDSRKRRRQEIGDQIKALGESKA